MLPFISLTCISQKSVFHCQNFNPFSSFCRFSLFFFSLSFCGKVVNNIVWNNLHLPFFIYSLWKYQKKLQRTHPWCFIFVFYLNVHISFRMAVIIVTIVRIVPELFNDICSWTDKKSQFTFVFDQMEKKKTENSVRNKKFGCTFF